MFFISDAVAQTAAGGDTAGLISRFDYELVADDFDLRRFLVFLDSSAAKAPKGTCQDG